MAVSEKSPRGVPKNAAPKGANGPTRHQNRPRPAPATESLPSAGPTSRPLSAYAMILAAFAGAHLLASLLGRLPALRPLDLVLLSLATFRFGRVMAGDLVTAPLRAPFVETKAENIDETRAEVQEVPSGSGLRVALGQVASCPSCIGFWGAALQIWGLMIAPGLTRPFVWLLAASGGSEFLRLLASRGQQKDS